MKLHLLLSLVCLFLSGNCFSASGGKGNGGPSPAAAMQSGRIGGTGMSGEREGSYMDPRRAPPMDKTRKVKEQDCSKPVDLSGGNLRCK